MNKKNNDDTNVTEQILEKKFIRGDYGLPTTFWGFGLGATLFVVFFMIAIIDSTGSDGSATLCFMLFVCYSTIISIAMWRSSNQYKGPEIWAVFAKMAVISLNLLILFVVFIFVSYTTSGYPNH